MATFEVTNDADSGPGSLRQAILDSNAATGTSNSIVFADDLNGQTIALQSSLSITSSVTIDGGTGTVVVSGGGAVGDFAVSGADTVASIDNLTIANGYAQGTTGTPGVAPPSNGTIPIPGDPQYQSSPGGPGGDAAGGIFLQSGSLTVDDDTFINDRAIGGTGGGSPGLLGFRGPGGAGGNSAGAIYVEPGASVTSAQNLIASNVYGGPGYYGSGNPVGDFGTGYQVSNDSTVNANTTIDNSVTVPPPVCFAGGTKIRIARDCAILDVAVEDLRVGDLAVTVSGARRAIRWLGHRTIECCFEPLKVSPVRVARDAFGSDLPTRDLYLSPGHPVLVDADEDGLAGCLVPIMCLVNGTTIQRVALNEVTYWHVELDQHDILLAEGLPTESYIDLGSRPWFEGADGALYDPDLALAGQRGRCRPVAVGGPVVEAERRRLDGLFAMRLASACGWPSDERTLAFG